MVKEGTEVPNPDKLKEEVDNTVAGKEPMGSALSNYDGGERGLTGEQ